MRATLTWIFPFVVVFFLWELIVYFNFFPKYIMPPPHEVLVLLWKMLIDGSLLKYTFVSFKNALSGLFIGTLVGLMLSALCAASKRAHDFFMPLLSAAYPVPTIIWVPLALLWFGFNSISLIFVVSLGCFFTTFYNSLIGLKSIDPIYIKMAKNLELSKWKYFKEIIVFGSFPHILTGLRLSVGWSWRIIIGAEMLASTVEGLGWFLWISSEFFKYREVFAGMMMIALIGLIFEKFVFEFIESKTIKKWY